MTDIAMLNNMAELLKELTADGATDCEERNKRIEDVLFLYSVRPLNARCWPVVRQKQSGEPLMVYAVCSTEEKAQACADNANQYYGDGHPMYPLVVDTSRPMFDPRPLPTQNTTES